MRSTMSDLLHRFGCALQIALSVLLCVLLVRCTPLPLWAAALLAVPAGMLLTWAVIMAAGVVLDR